MLPITFMLNLLPPGGAATELELRTVSGGVLCSTPFQLRKAIVAVNRGDERQVRQLGCIRTNAGTKATLIEQITLPGGPWQVQLVPTRGPSTIMWGYASSFMPTRQ